MAAVLMDSVGESPLDEKLAWPRNLKPYDPQETW